MIEILRAGLCDLVMDLGRPGWGAFGVPAGGAADPVALATANRLAGNPAEVGGLEIVRHGPLLRFPRGGVVALTGATFVASRSSGVSVAWNETLVLAAGETLGLEQARNGWRCWLAVRGGIVVPTLLGSGSTFLPGGFGGHEGRALQVGDRLDVGVPASEMHLLRTQPPGDDAGACLRVVAGPQADLFDDTGLAAFFGGGFRVDPATDRRGIRLNGPAVTHARTELPSQAVRPGAVQVPPDGQPILLGWDGPVTGGYPVIGTVIEADWPRLAQLKPGDAVRFVTVEADVARALVVDEWDIRELG